PHSSLRWTGHRTFTSCNARAAPCRRFVKRKHSAMDILRRQFLQHVGQTSPSPMLVEVERAEGVCFFTPEGKKYYDLIAGVSVSNVGHGNPAVAEAVCRQARAYMHVMVYGELVERPQVRYAA